MPQPRVLLVASEAVPLVKTGGLADVITALACALRQQEIACTILMPGYPAALEGAGRQRKVADLPDLPGGPGVLVQGVMPGLDIPVLMLDTARFRARTANPYVDHDGTEYDDNALCFGALAHAAVEICAGRTALPVPHVVHANDWHAGLIAPLLHAQSIRHVGTALTIHNLAFQGNYCAAVAPQLGLPADMMSPDGIEFWGQLSFLKAGILYADRITTVSETYAREILTPRFGHGFDGVLNQRRDVLSAIPNGVDMDVWNPARDPLIARGFDLSDMSGKASCKRDLQKLFKLPIEPFAPVMAVGSRMTHQKMVDVVLEAIPLMLAQHPRMQLAVLGCGDHAAERAFEQCMRDYPGRIGVHIGYDEHLAHVLHAGADMLLHPTRFEPYGLTPLYSLLYGTIPVTSRVGGLCDTVVDAGSDGEPAEGANGVLFDGDTVEPMLAAVDRAFALMAQPKLWQQMQRNALASDFAWTGPARQYIRLYAELAPAEAKRGFLAALAPRPLRMTPPRVREYLTA